MTEKLCWICHRTEAEIPNAVKAKTAALIKMENLAEEILADKKTFIHSMTQWKDKIPSGYYGFDIIFVANNPKQFNGFEGSKLSLIRDYVMEINGFQHDIDSAAASGLTIGKVSADLSYLEDKFLPKIRQSEKNKLLPLNLNGLNVSAGADYLIEVGQYYYDYQLLLLNDLMDEEKTKMSLWQEHNLTVGDKTVTVAICVLCEKLIRQFAKQEAKAIVRQYG